MSPVLVSILALVALFVVGTALPINMGALGFVAAWLVGVYSLGLSERDIVGGISGDLILTLVGVTYLFAIARNNGTVDLIVRAAVRAVGGRVALVPWVMFTVTAVLTAIGAASPAACAIVGPVALGFAGRCRINALMMGMLVVHGAQAGGFSPISIYGVITNSVMAENGLPVDEATVFLTSLLVNLAIAVVLFLALGGRELMSRRVAHEEIDGPPAGADRDGGPGDDGSGDDGPGDDGPGDDGPGVAPSAASTTAASTAGPPAGATATSTATRPDPHTADTADTDASGSGTRSVDQVVTLVAFAVVAAVALVFDRNIGFTAITAAVVLTALFPRQQKDAIKQVAWPTVLLVAGVSCFAAVLDEAGAPEAVGTWAAGLGAVVVGALVLCYVGGITSAFASSTALLPIIVPIAVPLVAQGGVGAVAVVAALAVSSTIVDVSPFSTNGALMVANRPDTISEERYYKQVLVYSALVTAVGPLLVWAAVVVPSAL